MTQNAPPVDEINSCQENYASEFDREIAELEQTIVSLKHRQVEIELTQREQNVLKRQQNELKHQNSKHPDLQQELEQIRSRLEELTLILESPLLNEWKLGWELFLQSIKSDTFWQAVRFGGLGIAIGWFISTWGK
jgi:predicted RNase H-like nuclease (RuvC/YqgF family)